MKIRSQASLEPVPCYWGSKGTSALRSIPANNGAAFLSWNLQPSHLLLAGCVERPPGHVGCGLLLPGAVCISRPCIAPFMTQGTYRMPLSSRPANPGSGAGCSRGPHGRWSPAPHPGCPREDLGAGQRDVKNEERSLQAEADSLPWDGSVMTALSEGLSARRETSWLLRAHRVSFPQRLSAGAQSQPQSPLLLSYQKHLLLLLAQNPKTQVLWNSKLNNSVRLFSTQKNGRVL